MTNVTNIAAAIIESTKRNQNALLNWDHSFENPTSMNDICQNLVDYLTNECGQEGVVVELDNDMLKVSYLQSSVFARGSSFGTPVTPNRNLVLKVHLNGLYTREIYGRVHRVIGGWNIWSLASLMHEMRVH